MRPSPFASIVFCWAAAAGCRSREESRPPASSSQTRATEPAIAAPIDRAPSSDEPAVLLRRSPPGTEVPEYGESPLRVDADGLARLLPRKPGLPAPLRSIEMGMRIDDAKIAERWLAEGPLARDAEDDWWPAPGFPGTVVRVSTIYDGARPEGARWVDSVSVLLPRNEARALVTRVWGEPITVVPPEEEERLTAWVNVEDGYYAVLEESQTDDPRTIALTIFRYATLERLLGDAPDRFGFEPEPYLGKTIAEVLAVAPRAHRPTAEDGAIDLFLPRLELASRETSVALDAESGRVTRVMLFVPYSLRPRVEALVAKKGSRFHVEDGGSWLRIRSSL